MAARFTRRFRRTAGHASWYAFHSEVRLELAYLIVTGTTTAPLAIELARGLRDLVPRVITIATPHAARVIAPRDLSTIPGNQLVESYFDAAILPRPPDGLVLVAPCSFNSLNKLAGGVADNLALSMTAEAIGRLTPVVVAVSVNPPLYRHPRTAASIATLREWGVSVIEPVDTGEGLRMAPTAGILAETERRLAAHARQSI
jgi:phosphopantothenoylcysteine synthetase/decarboxylase